MGGSSFLWRKHLRHSVLTRFAEIMKVVLALLMSFVVLAAGSNSSDNSTDATDAPTPSPTPDPNVNSTDAPTPAPTPSPTVDPNATDDNLSNEKEKTTAPTPAPPQGTSKAGLLLRHPECLVLAAVVMAMVAN